MLLTVDLEESVIRYGMKSRYEAVDVRWGRGRGGVFMFLIQGASQLGATPSRTLLRVALLHVAPPSALRVTCSSIVAGNASLAGDPMRCVVVEWKGLGASAVI